MEDGLIGEGSRILIQKPQRLNPCFDGKWSQSRKRKASYYEKCVLILVVMDNGIEHANVMGIGVDVTS